MVGKTGGGLICLLALLLGSSRASAATTRQSELSELNSASSALLAAGVRRPYGAGWPADPSEMPSRQPRIGLGPGQTPAAALVLYRAGKELSDSRFSDTAIAAARGIARCQLDTGRIADEGVFARFPVGRDLTAGARDRANTTAALGLFLEIIRTQKTPDARLVEAAGRAAIWLMRQQLHDGAWPTELKFTDSKPATRYLRLDTADWRDCTLALLEAGQILDRQDLIHGGEGAANVLILLQLDDPKAPWAGGWAPLYQVNGKPVKEMDKAVYALNTRASMRAAQTLVGHFLLTYEPPTRTALDRFALTMNELRSPAGDWYRMYGLPASPALPATRSDEVHIRRMFETATSRESDRSGIAPEGLGELLETISLLQKSNLGPLSDLSGPGPLSRFRHDHIYEEISSTLCGVTDAPFVDSVTGEDSKDWGDSTPQDSAIAIQVRHVNDILVELNRGD